ncbi:lytic transglycosylase domain-containing protein [Ectothiorhodospira mobilis]|uniref:lytic transglycosylase domain-containing protein n=1 Tax=Ectothiorhodospira mobilis TaxID=195064 RepID=UPI001906B721|nr:lytic transglycosylase domain-containing protein [Ectothiorhodospira mobilis]MBK1692234.1 lytic transglycosylase [Ectothiorhodospira mobilis]
MHTAPPIRRAAPWLLALALAQGTAAADEVYVHRDEHGGTWFTDQREMGEGFTFIERRYYGRPPARSACRGLTPDALERRAQREMGWVRHYARLNGLDHRLIRAMITVESCFDRHAVSRVGARGLMQLMPATARELGVEDAFDPRQNIRGGTTYFARMLQRFHEDTRLALAAYNAGPGAVERHDGIPPYPETRDYVTRVMSLYQGLGGG